MHLNVRSIFIITQKLYSCLLRDSGRPLLVEKYDGTKPRGHFKRQAPNNGCLLSRELPQLSGAPSPLYF